MVSSNKLSLKVAGILFILFILFVAFKDVDLTGSFVVDVSSVEETYNYGDVVSGTLNMEIEEGDFILNDSIISLVIRDGSELLNMHNRSAQEVFGDFLEAVGSKEGYGFNQVGDYELDVSLFELRTYEVGEFNLSLEYMDKVLDYKLITYNSAEESGFGGLSLFGFEGIKVYENGSYSSQGDEEFEINDYVACYANYSGDSLDVEFYRVGSNEVYESFLDVENNQVESLDNISAYSKGSFCSSGVCFSFLRVEETWLGEWKCLLKVNKGEENHKKILSLNMTNSLPVLKKEIPSYNLSVDGLYNSSVDLNMGHYFEDPNNDGLDFVVYGNKYVSVTVNPQEEIVFSNLDNFEGEEILTVKALDGLDHIYSNDFVVKFGSGNNIPVEPSVECVPGWQCTPWSGCIAGSQTRVCIDVNDCGIEEGQPLELEECTDLGGGENTKGQTSSAKSKSSDSSFNPIFLVGFFLGIGLIIFFAIFIFLKKRKKKDSTSFKVENFEEKEEVGKDELKDSNEVGVELTEKKKIEKVVNPHEIDNYIEKAIKSKMDFSKIRENLVKAGWHSEDVDKKIAFYKAKKFIVDKIKEGYSEESLKESFSKKGWSSEQISQLFGEE